MLTEELPSLNARAETVELTSPISRPTIESATIAFKRWYETLNARVETVELTSPVNLPTIESAMIAGTGMAGVVGVVEEGFRRRE